MQYFQIYSPIFFTSAKAVTKKLLAASKIMPFFYIWQLRKKTPFLVQLEIFGLSYFVMALEAQPFTGLKMSKCGRVKLKIPSSSNESALILGLLQDRNVSFFDNLLTHMFNFLSSFILGKTIFGFLINFWLAKKTVWKKNGFECQLLFCIRTQWGQRCTYRVLQTIHMKLIFLCVWAEPAVLGSAKNALKFKYEL